MMQLLNFFCQDKHLTYPGILFGGAYRFQKKSSIKKKARKFFKMPIKFIIDSRLIKNFKYLIGGS